MKILEKDKVLVFASVSAIVGVAAVLPGRAVYAGIQDGADVTKEGNELGQAGDLETTVKNVINIILYVIGIVAVVMMIFGGFQYITSAGDAAKVTKAKNTILYGVVGLVIAILAYAIVNYVLGSLTN